ncbi:chloride channel protein [Basilea psittacipulmonis]|uniref:Chloride channel protein n=1 Tax=Basilea psittacipulmonis DSM 24701 TaxID=1072685 RepID=A0A077DG24_9BURK|nr:chloride channel protein [Basilea psittacipulmonis]AIL32108.1 hypothetical protein IX83_01115 [Basilea psittacipulmonis DSM 24701]
MLRKFHLAFGIICIAILTGLGAAFLSWLIHHIEVLSFGHSESQYPIVTDHTTPTRRLLSMLIGGVIVAICLCLLQTKGRAVVGIKGILSGKTAPFIENCLHAILQIVGVGCGAPIGREVAPREIGALFAQKCLNYFHIDAKWHTPILASSAAAGLAAVYHVPFAGAIFALEILLGSFSIPFALIALSISLIATLVARITVDSSAFYHTIQIDGSLNTILFSALVGLVVSLPATWFKKQSNWAETSRYKGYSLLWSLPTVFLISGVIAIFLPEILGNGRSAAQTAFNHQITLLIAIALFFAKWFAVIMTLKGGAFGGTLTPGLSLGAILGLIVGLLCQYIFPDVPLAAMTLSGACAFLAVSMQAPLTAFALVISFTAQGYDSYLPLITAVTLAMGLHYFVKKASA